MAKGSEETAKTVENQQKKLQPGTVTLIQEQCLWNWSFKLLLW
jgi:hypothetical protein